MRQLIAMLAVLALATPAIPAAAQQQTPAQALTNAIASSKRDSDRAQDAIRHPAETLTFFRVVPGMTVAEILPGAGWYARLLIPYLGKSGRYIGLNPDIRRANDPLVASSWGSYSKKFPSQLARWGLADTNAVGYNLDDSAPLPGTVDRAIMVREVHNLFRFDLTYSTLSGIRRILKPDGLLGIVQHRARPWAKASYVDGSKGYMRERDVIALVEAHGFELVETSEINANRRDTADYPGGIWDFPQTGTAKTSEQKDIGDTDRMTLLFRKRP